MRRRRRRLGRGEKATACFGAIAASAPPAGCIGWPIDGWRWEQVAGATALGTSAGEEVRQAYVHLTVRVVGSALVMTRPVEVGSSPHHTGTTPLPCTTIGDREPPLLQPSALEPLLESDGARAAGVYANNRPGSVAAYRLEPTILLLPLLADTPSVRRWVLDAFDGGRVELCASLRPAGA